MRAALAVAVLLFAVGIALAALTLVEFVVLLLCYIALTLSLLPVAQARAGRRPGARAAGFLIRAVAGGLAAALPDLGLVPHGRRVRVAVHRGRQALLSCTPWAARRHRRSLVRYTDSYLRFVWSIAAAVTVTAYCLWAFENAVEERDPLAHASILPFVVGLMRYAVDVDAGEAAEPEDIVGDRLLAGHRRGLGRRAVPGAGV